MIPNNSVTATGSRGRIVSTTTSSSNGMNGSRFKKPIHRTFLARLRWALLIVALFMGIGMFFLLHIAHSSSLSDSSHVSVSLVNSRQKLHRVGAGGMPEESQEEEEEIEEDPEEEREEEELKQQLQKRILEKKEAEAQKHRHEKPTQKVSEDLTKAERPSSPKDGQTKKLPQKQHQNVFAHKDQQDNNAPQNELDEEEQQRLKHKIQQAARRDAALREFENNNAALAQQRGGEAAVSVSVGGQKDDMDAAHPAKVRAIKAALALDQAKREDTAKEEQEQEKILAADPERNPRVRIISNNPHQAEQLKERDRLWDIYSQAVVDLAKPELRRSLDPLYIESIDTPSANLYRVPFTPKVEYLGVLVDAGRHYFPIPWWKQLIVYLYKLKFNLIQFRLTDDQTFNVQLESYPKLATPVLLDYNTEKRVYTPQELKELVAFAKQYNISLVPEVNVPGHAGAWAGIPDLVVMCPEFICNEGYGLPLNIEHPEIKEILTGVLKEILDIFDNPPFLHLGGDEVNMADPCFAEARRKPFNYTDFEDDLSGILQELNYPINQVIRWERTGQSLTVQRAGDIEHFWQSMPGMEAPMGKFPNGEFKPWFMSRGLYFDVDHEDDGLAIYRYVQGAFHQQGGIPPPKAIIAGTFELGTEFWLQRNVATRLIAAVMGSAEMTHKSTEFTEMFNKTCHDLGVDGRWCNLQGNTATLLQDYLPEHHQTWKAWKSGICNRLTESEMKLTLKDNRATRNSLQTAGYDIFWENFGEDPPPVSVPLKGSNLLKVPPDSPLKDHSIPFTGVIFDMVNSITSPPSRVAELLRFTVAPLGFNTLQLRLVDNNGFAIKLKTQPKLGYTTLTQISNIPESNDYEAMATTAMKELGVQIIPEIALSTNAGGWINSGFAANCPQIVCDERKGIATDVAEPGFLPVVYSVMKELREIFPSPLLHLGDDDRQAALEGCLREGGRDDKELALFEEKLATLVGLLNITQDQIIRWENQEGKIYEGRNGIITQHRARRSNDLPKVNQESPFFVTVDILEEHTPWDIYVNTRALVELKPTGVLGEIRDIGEDIWDKKNVGLRLVAFAMGLQRTSDNLDEQSFHKLLLEACSSSGISGCEEQDGVKDHPPIYNVDLPRYHDKMCAEFTYKALGRVVRKNIV